MTQDAKPLRVEEVIEQLNIYAEIASTEHEEFYIRAAIATLDRLNAQLAMARTAPEDAIRISERGRHGNHIHNQVSEGDIARWREALAALDDDSKSLARPAHAGDTLTIGYWRRNAHEALDTLIDAEVQRRLSPELKDAALAATSAQSELTFLTREVVNHIENARRSAAIDKGADGAEMESEE